MSESANVPSSSGSDTVQAFLDEAAVLDDLVAGLDEADWAMSTPAPRWSIAHQIGHLAWADEVSLTSATEPEGFARLRGGAGADPLGYVDEQADAFAALPPDALLARWREARTALAAALAAADPQTPLPWFGPPMSPRSMATARLMETWAHGQDVADALGVRREPTARLRDICHLGVRTRNFAYTINRYEPPAEEFRVELTAPDGDHWTWGPEDAASAVRGTAEDFCLLVTQRREPTQTDLEVTGEAGTWATLAQAFAGAPKSVVRSRV